MSYDISVVFDPPEGATETLINNWERELGGLIMENLRRAAEQALDIIDNNTPVVTGNLRSGNFIQQDMSQAPRHFIVIFGNSAVNIKGKGYGRMVNDGYRHWRSGQFVDGRHFVEMSVPEIEEVFKNVFITKFSKSWRGWKNDQYGWHRFGYMSGKKGAVIRQFKPAFRRGAQWR